MKQRRDRHVASFYIRRFFRIAPLYYFGIAFYFAWGTAKIYLDSGGLAFPPQYSFLSVLSNLSLLHAFYSPANNSIVPGGWSVATEMVFYGVFPWLFRFQSAHTLKNLKRCAALVFMTSLMVHIAIHLILNRKVDTTFFLYGSLINQLSVFVIGICTYRMLSESKPSVIHRRLALTAFLLAFFISTTALKTGFNGAFYPALVGIGFSYALVHFSKVVIPQTLFWKCLVNVGRVSFSMYISHFFFLDLWVRVAPFTSYLLSSVSAVVELILTFLGCALFTFLTSIITRKCVEQPGIRLGDKLCRRIEC
jgi:peptidoglycan/LPS O-acetylase OafA/YrhL